MYNSEDLLLIFRRDELAQALSYMEGRTQLGSRLLEIGAGTGHQARLLLDLGYIVSAVDTQESPYLESRIFPVQDYDGKHLPFEADTFDVVFSSNALEHVDDLDTLLREATRTLKPGGLAIHIMPTSAWRWWTLVSHFPWVLLRAQQSIFRGNSPRQVELGRRTHRATLKRLIASVVPRRHGCKGSLIGELWTYRRSRWVAELMQSGLEFVGSQAGGIFYTGAQVFGSRLRVESRRRLARFLGSAVRVYCFCKPP